VSFPARFIRGSCAAALLVLATGGAARAAPAKDPCLLALVTHEEEKLGADGVTRSSRFQELYYRCADRVWIARVLPPGGPALRALDGEHADHGDHHRHGHDRPDTIASPRLITKGEGGRAELAIIVPERRLLIEVDDSDRSTVGFDASWDEVSHLIAPREFQAMSPAKDAPDPGPGLHWRERRRPGRLLRVLWSDEWRVPVRVEAEHGSVRRVMTAVILPWPGEKAAPWHGVAGYARKGYSDFGD
jgi:hypothetical protein